MDIGQASQQQSNTELGAPRPAPITSASVPKAAAAGPTYALNDQPQAVVKVLSVRGLEYLMMTVALWVGADALAGILLALVNGGTNVQVLAFPASALVVSVAVFALFFLRLKKAELANPSLRFDPSKRRLSQITQVFSYVVCLFTLIGLVYSIVAKVSGNMSGSYVKLLLDFLVIFVVAGGILAYYWINEHRG